MKLFLFEIFVNLGKLLLFSNNFIFYLAIARNEIFLSIFSFA